MPNLRVLVAKRIALPLKSLVKGEPTTRVLRELDANQWLPPERLHALRTKRLRELLVAVAGSVPFYREQMGRLGAQPEVDDPWRVLGQLPLIDKNLYRDLGASLRSERPRHRPMIGHTSGTTGERLEVRSDRSAGTYMYLAGLRGRRWWGIEPGDPEFKIWGSGRETARTKAESIQGILKALKERALGVTLVSPFFRTDENLERAAALLFRSKPALVFGYANSIHLLSGYMARKGLRAGPGWPRAVIYTAEMLSDSQGETIRSAFGAPLVAEYGSCEAGVMAYQCPEGSLHTSDDILSLEVLSDGEPVGEGRVGEVVVTNLMATEYPLIRYRQGDLGRRGGAACGCGRSLGVLGGLVGRMNDVLTSPSGGIIDFIVFDKAMKDQPALRRFKIVERAAGDLVLLYETYPGEAWREADRARLLEQCRSLLPPDVEIETRAVDHLPPEPSGKFRIMIRKEEAARYL